jgi:hypothetical protein
MSKSAKHESTHEYLKCNEKGVLRLPFQSGNPAKIGNDQFYKCFLTGSG